MNSLLERMAAADREAGLEGGRQARRALALLEWPRVLEQIAACCRNRAASARLRRRRPYRSLDSIQLWWSLADEVRAQGEAGHWPPLVDVSPLPPLSQGRPLQLGGEKLLDVAAVAEGLDGLRDHLARHHEFVPIWSDAAAELRPFGSLVQAIRAALQRDGRLRDDASPLLGRLRRQAAAQERAVRGQIEQEMAELRRRGWATGDEVVMRGDRFCLPLRADERRRIEGIVHARSASGGTLFVEPAAVVQLHNDLTELRQALAAEEARLMLELNRLVEAAAGELREACRFHLLLDQVQATVRWSLAYGGRRPRLAPQGPLRLVKARHPLLAERVPQAGAAVDARPASAPDRGGPAGPREPVVPLDLTPPAERPVVLISGPNAGGKTVALKTVGISLLLAQCGWDVPAREDSSLPLVRRLCVDLGDEQSIARSLSSFSAHLGNLAEFLSIADEDTLVLCDEIGTGTDPQEGTALAFAFLEALVRRGSRVIATTHYGLLKAAAADHPAMINAAMAFDEETLSPLFTLELGRPGASHAFAIASRMGMPRDLLARARSLVGEERFQIERLLTALDRRDRELAEAARSARAGALAVARLEQELAARLAESAREREQARQEVRREGERLLQEGRRLLERTVREIRSGSARPDVVRRAHRELEELADRLPAAEAPGPPPTVQPGQRIRIPDLGLTGRVVEVRGERVVAEAAGLRLTVGREGIEPLAAQDDKAAPAAAQAAGPLRGGWRYRGTTASVRHEIDLRGLRGEEAWHQLDMLIDRAIPAGLTEIRAVHGIGTGRLREYLHGRLADDERVAGWEPAPLERGGHGVTIVRLAVG